MAQTMGPERRLHPASFVFRMGTHLKALLVPGAAVLFTARSSGRDWEVWLMVLLVPYTIAALVRSLSFRYRFDADEMVVRKGWVFRSERHIPYARIQNIDAVQNVFHRLLHVAEVRVETASGGEPEATMTVLPEEALSEMRQFVFAGRQAAVVPETAPSEAEPDLLLRMHPREVLLYGFIESRGAVVMAGGAGLLWEFGLFDRFFEQATDGELAGRGVLRQLVRSAFGEGGPSLALIGRTVAAFVVLFFILRLLSMAWAFVRLHGFTLRRAGDDLRVNYGLLTRISGTIPLQRIQTLTISDGPLHRLFGRVSVHVDTAGGDGGQAQPRRREPIAPLVHQRSLDELTADLLPTVMLTGVAWQPPHSRAFRRAFFRTSVAVTILLLFLTFLLRTWTLAAMPVLFLWAGFYARKYVANLGWAFAGDAIVFKSGWLWRRVTVARFSKIQAVAWLESPFDRRMGMATVKVDTAGAGDAAHSVEIPFLPAETATSLASTLDAHAAQTAFRW
jgi:putative membrane protein